MLVELMVVSVAVLILFIAVYTNFYPSMGEYENRIYYNNLETEYALFYTKVMYLKYFHENEDIEKDFFSNNLSNSYVNLIENGNCNNFNFSTNFLNKCNLLANTYEIDTLILTTYDTSNIKNVSITDEKLSKYISLCHTTLTPLWNGLNKTSKTWILQENKLRIRLMPVTS